MLEEKINEIVTKVRNLCGNELCFKYALRQKPIIVIKESENDIYEIESIEFRWYDRIFVYKDKLVYSAPHKRNKILFKYSGFDDLLKIKQIDFDNNPIKIQSFLLL